MDLGTNLHRVGLGSVVGKDIGKTEKNLRRAFAGAANRGEILLFDGGDVFFRQT